MIYTAVCFGYSLTEEFGEHFESVDGGDLFQGDCVEVNDLKDVKMWFSKILGAPVI